ncbi:unnamed protein product [Ceratitis capitata]|uniref:(Mediterranean fruit fly) hypothetical protein n=1 Tax=Ceratitis capitata TaxID=7213 RepID=A0A811VH08_CERCA|nr:unnamed protein product [Ceratitis capitata]
MSLQCDETQVSIKDGLGGLKPARHYALVVVLSNAMNDLQVTVQTTNSAQQKRKTSRKYKQINVQQMANQRTSGSDINTIQVAS